MNRRSLLKWLAASPLGVLLPKVAVAEEVVFDSAPLPLDGKADGKSKTFTWVVETDLKGGDNGTSKS